ncbi:MAG: protease SohB [Gammaproteobacteria bacterium]|nr:MAG: protease SohB [Gammaproteobacteria bacterium]
MEFLYDFGLFLLKSITIVAAILIVVGGIISSSQRGKVTKSKGQAQGAIKLTNLSERYKDMVQDMQQDLLTQFETKALNKAEKKAEKEKNKQDKINAKALKKSLSKDQLDAETLAEKAEDGHKRLFVIDFNGDMKASAVNSLREEISAIIAIAGKQDEVLLRLESPGGMVHGYGLAASQLQRLRIKDINLTIAVDMVAASGGYMMACVANKIVAAPFAIIGSIGVIAQIPNFNRLLKKMDVDYEQHTAGEYKRTLTIFGENTDKDREKFREELEDTHQLFKSFITSNRPELDIEKVATGEHWYGTQAIEKGLIDEISTSDDLILQAVKDTEVFEVNFEIPKSIGEKFGLGVESTVNRLVMSWWQSSAQSPKL